MEDLAQQSSAQGHPWARAQGTTKTAPAPQGSCLAVWGTLAITFSLGLKGSEVTFAPAADVAAEWVVALLGLFLEFTVPTNEGHPLRVMLTLFDYRKAHRRRKGMYQERRNMGKKLRQLGNFREATLKIFQHR